MEDSDAWIKYPQYRKFFDKLYLAQLLGYDCGPSGLAPSRSDWYIVRPTYNLSGMSAGARIQYIESGDYSCVEPGYFWCEVFTGQHISVTYNHLKPINAWEAEVEQIDNAPRFTRWYRVYRNLPKLPDKFNTISSTYINAEFIGDKLIEIHFRPSPDPEYDELIPVWSDREYDSKLLSKQGYKFISSFDNANGFIKHHRIGFYVK